VDAPRDARWTLLDAFESDGKRYIVAIMENPAVTDGPVVLSARERQVVAFAALGKTNKLIAYELGLSDSTVRVLLARAAKKLGVNTRTELVALYQAYAARDPEHAGINTGTCGPDSAAPANRQVAGAVNMASPAPPCKRSRGA
jgi:DNA-binding CsgD family transcriptional regulator